MIAVSVNHATLARWRQQIVAEAKALRTGVLSSHNSATSLERVAEEIDDLLAPESRDYRGVVVYRTGAEHAHAGVNENGAPFKPLCAPHSSFSWRSEVSSLVTCRHCLRLLREKGGRS